MGNLISFLAAGSAQGFCKETAISNVMYLVGVVVAVIRIAIPIILIVIGMTDLIKALTSQDDKQIKQATTLLIKKVVIGVVIFLVPTLVRLIMNIIAQEDYKACITCVTNVWGHDCSWKQD